ncbi:hypothetical protein CDD83_6784 [Cordyceps sp. RAO-2017]|nr:hypothetical protein CDD83_6784 [Cordyceps sp. RAO-2017]
MLFAFAASLAALGLAVAQFVSEDPRGRNLTVVRSPADAGVTVSFKQPEAVCKTALDSQKQYTGWANIPGRSPTNLFFWFVEAREPTQSLTIWLNGGPGSSSMLGFFTGNGPCELVERSQGEYDTVARQWGWDRASNMLFIDQPNQVGFSYDTPTNGSIILLNDTVVPFPMPADPSFPDWALLNGTFSTANPDGTANSTKGAAMAVWHTLQGFLTTFPQYQPSANSSVALSLFAESYGGIYGPVFAETFETQNQRRLTGELPRATTLELRLTSLGIVNGLVDMMTQMPTLPAFAVNNTYGIKTVSDREANLYSRKFFARGGCRDLLVRCQAAASGPPARDASPQVDDTQVCINATKSCFEDVENPSYGSDRSPYDLSGRKANPQPPYYFADYLNQARVQKAVGSPVNFTMTNTIVGLNFAMTGDVARGGNIARLAALVRRGVRVGLMYGDRDHICNWFGGEAVSLAIAQQAGGDYGTRFPAAGYARIYVNASNTVGGVVRQYGNLSFSRIYQAGHTVPWYQPETAFVVFARILLGRSISMGNVVDLGTYNSTGGASATHTDRAPDAPEPTCFVRAFEATCDGNASRLASQGGAGAGVVVVVSLLLAAAAAAAAASS